MMTPEQREQIRLSVMRHLDAASGTKYGFSEKLLLQFVRNEGYRQITAEEFAAEMLYLQDKKCVTAAEKTISPENRHWRITADGRDFYAQQQA